MYSLRCVVLLRILVWCLHLVDRSQAQEGNYSKPQVNKPQTIQEVNSNGSLSIVQGMKPNVTQRVEQNGTFDNNIAQAVQQKNSNIPEGKNITQSLANKSVNQEIGANTTTTNEMTNSSSDSKISTEQPVIMNTLSNSNKTLTQPQTSSQIVVINITRQEGSIDNTTQLPIETGNENKTSISSLSNSVTGNETVPLLKNSINELPLAPSPNEEVTNNKIPPITNNVNETANFNNNTKETTNDTNKNNTYNKNNETAVSASAVNELKNSTNVTRLPDSPQKAENSTSSHINNNLNKTGSINNSTTKRTENTNGDKTTDNLKENFNEGNNVTVSVNNSSDAVQPRRPPNPKVKNSTQSSGDLEIQTRSLSMRRLSKDKSVKQIYKNLQTPGKDEGCHIKGRHVAVGDFFTVPGLCGVVTCGPKQQRIFTTPCPPLKLDSDSECYITDKTPSRGFPECCPQLICRSEKIKQSNPGN